MACQLICCSSLIILEDVLLGIQEGDALAIMRTVHDLTKWAPPPLPFPLRLPGLSMDNMALRTMGREHSRHPA